MDDTEELTKVHIDLGDNPDSGGEAMWAKALGRDLYELRNIPFHAYDLNFLDVVRAIAPRPDLKPSIEAVVRRSGHRTMWVTFAESVDRETRAILATELNEWRGYFEGKDGRYFAIDVEPEGSYEHVLARIEEWRQAGLVDRYRTGPSSSDVREA
jgi:hypothetical protein